MISLTRRALGKWLASAAATLHLPLAPSLVAAPAAQKPRSLLDQVQEIVDGLAPETIKQRLDGTYAKVFKRLKSTMQVEQIVHLRYLGLAELKQNAVLVDKKWDDYSGPRFVYNAATYEVAFGFAVAPDNGSTAQQPLPISLLEPGYERSLMVPGIYSLIDLKRGNYVPWRFADMAGALVNLLTAFRLVREIDAAHILNHATTYDPAVGGDGVPLLSPNHPWDDGVWANTCGDATPPKPSSWPSVYRPLTLSSFSEACERITQFHDDAGLRIVARPTALITGSDLANDAARIAGDLPHIVWDDLRSGAWFVQTSIEGLRWFERRPFELSVWQDPETGMVFVHGYERRLFTYTEPRSLFGCVPPRAPQGI